MSRSGTVLTASRSGRRARSAATRARRLRELALGALLVLAIAPRAVTGAAEPEASPSSGSVLRWELDWPRVLPCAPLQFVVLSTSGPATVRLQSGAEAPIELPKLDRERPPPRLERLSPAARTLELELATTSVGEDEPWVSLSVGCQPSETEVLQAEGVSWHCSRDRCTSFARYAFPAPDSEPPSAECRAEQACARLGRGERPRGGDSRALATLGAGMARELETFIASACVERRCAPRFAEAAARAGEAASAREWRALPLPLGAPKLLALETGTGGAYAFAVPGGQRAEVHCAEDGDTEGRPVRCGLALVREGEVVRFQAMNGQQAALEGVGELFAIDGVVTISGAASTLRDGARR